MRWTLEMDNEGQRFWLCHHSTGDLEDLPPDWALQFLAGKRRDAGAAGDPDFALPLGTQVWMEQPGPEEAAEIENTAILRVLRYQIQKNHRQVHGEELGDEAADALVQQTLRELLEGSLDPAIQRGARAAIEKAGSNVGLPDPPLILPGKGPLAEQVMRAARAAKP